MDPEISHNINISESLSNGRVRYIKNNFTTIGNQFTNFLISGASLFFCYFILVKQYLSVAESITEKIIICFLCAICLLPVIGHLLNNRLRRVNVAYKPNWPNIIETYFIEQQIPILFASNRIICAQKSGGLFTAGRAWIVIFDGHNIYLNTQTLNKDNWPSTFNYITNQIRISDLVRYIDKNAS